MKVLHLVSIATKTGPADPAVELARAQREHLGWDAYVAFDRMREGDMPIRMAEAKVPEQSGLSLNTKGGILRALADRRVVKRLADEYDVIHAHASHDHGIAALARGSATLVRSIHHPRSLRRRAFQGIAYRRTDGLILLNETHRAHLLESYPDLEPARTALVAGAVDTDQFSPEADGRAFRAQMNVPEDAFVVGMCARFQAGRRQEDLARAFAAALQQTQSKLHLSFIGWGETKQSIEDLVDRLDLRPHTSFYGFRTDDLAAAYTSCDVTVLLKEGSDASCRAVLQSLACEVPVIGASHAAIVHALEGEDCGRLVQEGDVEALTAAIVELAEARDQVKALGRQGRSKMQDKFTEKARAEAVARFYEALAEAGPVTA